MNSFRRGATKLPHVVAEKKSDDDVESPVSMADFVRQDRDARLPKIKAGDAKQRKLRKHFQDRE